MKRHGFSGMGAGHGVQRTHRAPGAIGQCATPARVFKGTRMAGQHGHERVTTLNLQVDEGDAERGLLLVRGSVCGPTRGLVLVRVAKRNSCADERCSRHHEPGGTDEAKPFEVRTDLGINPDLRHQFVPGQRYMRPTGSMRRARTS